MFDLEHKIFLTESYFKNAERQVNGEWKYPIPHCINDFQNAFPNFPADYQKLVQEIYTCVAKFRNVGTVGRKAGSGAPKKRTPEIVADVAERMEQSPRKSIRRLAQEINLSYGTCQKILKENLNLYSYRINVVQELFQRDFPARIEYCQWFLNNLNNNNTLDLTFFTDEAWFYLSGYINKQNMRIWSSENPHEFIQSPLHSQKIGVWLAVSRRRIFGPVFFEGTINAERYRNNLLEPFFQNLYDDELLHGYFQQDNATAHKTRESLTRIREFYDNRVIEFPPRSPDLTILDYFIYPYLKNTVYKNNPQNLEELQEAISNACNAITVQMLANAFENMKRRVNSCIATGGEHFEHLL